MNRLPPDWRWASVDELAGGVRSNVVIGPFGSSLKVADYRSEGVPLVLVRNIRSRNFGPTATRFISVKKAEELRSHEVRPGDVLITKMGDPPGEAAVYPDQQPAVVSADCIRLRPGPGVSAKYVAYAFETPVVAQQIAEITRGVAQQKVSLGRFRHSVSIPLPPPKEQRRIVDLLEDHLSRLEVGTALIQASSRRLQALEQAVVDAVFIGAARRLQWPEGHLQDLADSTPGSITDGPFGSNLTSAHYTTDGARVVRLQNIGDGYFKQADSFVSLEHYDRLAKHDVRQGDVVVASLGERLPRAAVVPHLGGPAIVKADCIRVRTDSDVDPRWLAYGCRSSLAKRWAADQLHGLGRQRLGLKGIRAVPIPTPSSQEMRMYCDQIEGHLSQAAQLRNELEMARGRVVVLRRSVLASAFSARLAAGSFLDAKRADV